MSIQVGDKLRSTDPREHRVVRVIEIHDPPGQFRKRLRVENVKTERRTWINYPLQGRWALDSTKRTT